MVEQCPLQIVEGGLQVGTGLDQEGLPVDPLADELAVPGTGLQKEAGHGKQHERLGTRPGGEPVVGLRGGVGQSRVDADHRRATTLALHDALGVRVEVVASLQVG